jgi:pyrimidine deaminase RibD-like protein
MIDRRWMLEAIELAEGCAPIKESIPKVGAVIAIGEEPLGRGRRGTGNEGDGEHAEWNALDRVEDKDKSLLPKATLYTTLEPCTGDVRSEPLKACTELILQHEIKKVFIGILDPNQGVTGKGLWRLQNSGVEVSLFPDDLARRIRVLNADFIRSQQTLGATIISPTNGEALKTYETDGRTPVRFTCLNRPGANNYLFAFHNGLWWPQPGPFRLVGASTWEIDALFGRPGVHTLHLITATELGQALVEYYRRVVEENRERRARVKGKLAADDWYLLRSNEIGIPMAGLPKGLLSEASVEVTILAKPE